MFFTKVTTVARGHETRDIAVHIQQEKNYSRYSVFHGNPPTIPSLVFLIDAIELEVTRPSCNADLSHCQLRGCGFAIMQS